MTQNWRHLPAPARPVAEATVLAVAAARHHDNEALSSSVADLAALDESQVGLILGTTIRVILEDTHPDGVDGDDVRAILERCARAALPWHPDLDPHVLLLLLAGALGVHDDDGEPLPPPSSRATHAALLLADLIGDIPGGDDPAAKQVATYLTAALSEIERAQLND